MVNNPLSNSDLRSLITRNLGLLAQQNPQAVTQFFEGLGYGTDLGVDIDRPEQLLEILGSKSPRLERLLLSSENRQWQSISGVFQITDEQIKGQKGLFQTFDWHYLQSYVVVAVTLTGQDYKRSELAQFTRELNRLSDIPILVLFCHGVYVTLAVIHRRPNLKDSAKDVLEKITLIKDIDTRDPHRAQVEILAEFAVSSLQKSYQVRNFDDLHQAWLKVFDISILNKNFFAELSAWYFWAVEAVYFPGAEFGKEKNHQQISVIRLITRLIFIWFLKEKGIIDRELFQSESAGVLLKNFEENGSSSDYYRAILQNLFFATLNTERSAEKLGNRQFFDSISDLHRQDACSTNSDCGMGILPVQAPKVESVQTQKVESVQVPKVEYSQFFQYGDYFQDRDKWLALVKEIPFLNGGLFECLDQGEHRLDGFWDDEANPLSVPNYLFFGQEQTLDLSEITGNKQLKKQKVRGIFAIFNNYKFTVDENTPVEQEVALDPELLGKVFENLLAEYNPETETTARKKTGSFYTPREIVDYMVDEALLAYLMSRLWSGNSSGLVKLGSNQVQLFGDDYTRGQLSLHESVKLSNYSGTEADLERDLRDLLAYNDRNPLVNFPGLRQQITRAIAEIRVLDPACGSGAFPMGILQKLVYVLDQVDPRNDYWLEEQKNAEIAPLLADIEQAKRISYEAAREEAIAKLRERLAEIAAKFERESENYPRKLFLIERCIFGVDIQAIAVQIAKLRFFIALMVEQDITENKPNRGIVPLPNLETKFVAANTLIGITRSQTLRRPEVFEKEKALKEVRQEHFLAQTPMRKQVCRARDAQLRSEILA
ncbi:MAG: hypothetical protein VKK07_04755, partial [Merismopediaceae bacterium]|nr:hypothetical protein [Merismopediaceae bacterium]